MKVIPAISTVDEYIEVAIESGLPQDSLKRMLAAQYIAQPKQLELHVACREADNPDGPVEIGYGGARGGGKTAGVFAQVAIDDCQRFPNLKVLFLRKVGHRAEEGLNDLRLAMLRHVKCKYSRSVFTFPNESRIIAGHYQYEKDIDNYLSLEYDIIWIEQAEQITGKKIDLIRTVCRSSKGFRPRMIYTFNWGGVAHKYLKSKFITPYRKGTESNTRFIPATVYDNAMVNPEYRETLEALTGWQRRAWLFGDPDIAAGQYFDNWLEERLVKDLPSPTRFQRVWCSLDYGYNHPTVVYLFAERDGMIQMIDEVWFRKTLVQDGARAIKRMLAEHDVDIDRLETFVAGNDVFAQRGASDGKTIADQYEAEGIDLSPANEDRLNGAAYMRQLFGAVIEDKKGRVVRQIDPKIEISDRCTHFIETIPYLQANPNRMEDVLKVDANEDGENGDDPYDSGRYGVMVHADLFGDDMMEDAMNWSGK